MNRLVFSILTSSTSCVVPLPLFTWYVLSNASLSTVVSGTASGSCGPTSSNSATSGSTFLVLFLLHLRLFLYALFLPSPIIVTVESLYSSPQLIILLPLF